MKKRLLSILLTACLLAGLLPTAALAAEGDVEYLYCDANGTNWQTGTKTAREYTVVASDDTTWESFIGWYVVNRDVTIDSRVTVKGNVCLILADGCTLTVNGGIQVTGGTSPFGGNSLTIYGQENGTGTLITTGDDGKAGIGGGEDNSGGMIGGGIHGGNVTINGGTVKATGGRASAGIGGGRGTLSGGDGGTVTINGGTVTATGGRGGAGIGGGSGSFRTQEANEAKGSAMIFASSISDRSDEANWSGIIFPDWGWGPEASRNGKVYGDPTLPADLILRESYTLTIPAGASLTVPAGKTLSIPAGTTLINNGTLYCAGDTVINGTLTNYGTIYVDGILTKTATGTVSGDGAMYYLLTLTDCKVDAANTAAANTSTVNGKTFGKVGGTIYFTATPSANQLVTGWDVTKGVIKQETTDHSGCTISPMPAKPVTVKANFATALTVTRQPTGGTIDYGGSVTLSVTVSKHNSLNERSRVYQWYLDGSLIRGATGSSYTTPADLAAGNHTYTCKITYYANMRSYTVTSAPATVTVNPLAETAPNISIDYEAGTLTGFVPGSSYTINGTAVTTVDGKLSVENYFGRTLSIVTAARDDNHADSAAQTLTVPTRPDPPSSSECTIDNINETISFDSSKYEVNTVAGFTGVAVANGGAVTPGSTLYIRKKAVAETSFAS